MRHYVLTTSGDIVVCFHTAVCLSCRCRSRPRSTFHLYSLFRAKCSQDRLSIQNTENRHTDKRKKLWKHKNSKL